MKITTASARVMRSFDYSHFEIVLGATIDDGDDPQWYADELRKNAARLADKAVEHYKIAKANRYRLANENRDRAYEVAKIERIKAKSETDRSPEEQAQLKAHQDEVWEANRRFDYEDQWDDDEAEE